jgi:peptidoglycan/LPS O-acetylase OafA/YrhL
MAAVRYVWMFRTAAAFYLAFGLSAGWRYGFTDYDAPHRLWGLGFGLAAVVVGLFLFKPARFAIAISAISAALLAVAAAVAAPSMKGPVILAVAGVAVVFALYGALAGRVLLDRGR